MRVAVVGLGKLGLPFAAVASSRHEVVGVDMDQALLNKISSNGNFPEPYLNGHLVKYPLKVTSDPKDVREVELVFVFTNTEAGDVYSAASILGALRGLTAGCAETVIAIISTVEPGTFRNVILPFLDERQIVCKGLCYSPVMVAIGNAVRYFQAPPFVLLGATNGEARARCVQFYRELLGEDIPILQSTLENIEIAKYALNLALINRISMVNFLAEYCDKYKGNIDFLVEVLKRDERVTGRKMLSAGLGFGGPCFPMDARAFKRSCINQQIDPCLVDSIMRISSRVGERIVDVIASRPQRKVCILGVTYKPGTPYTIESQAIDVARRLCNIKDVMVYDPQGMDNARRELGDAVRYAPNLGEALKWGETILVAVQWPEFAGIAGELGSHQLLIDPWGLYSGIKVKADYWSPGRAAAGSLTPMGASEFEKRGSFARRNS